MAVKKKPDMSPVRAPSALPNETLMGNLDTKNRGDGERVQKVPTTVLLPADLKDEAQRVARDNDTTLTALIVQGLRTRMGKDF